MRGIYDEDSNDDDNVKLYSLENGGKLKEEYLFSLTNGCAQEATFNRAGDLLLLASKNVAEVRQVKDLEIVHKLIGHKNQISSVSFNKTGDQAVTCDFQDHILIWSVETGLCLHAIHSNTHKAFFVSNAIISRGFRGTKIRFVDTMHNLMRGLTFDQAFLINALYEIIILRRLAIIRAAAQTCRAFIDDAAIIKLNHCLSGSFDRNVQKIMKAGEALLTKLSAQPIPIVTDENTSLGIQDFVFDFRNKPQKWLTAYLTLPEPVRDVLVRYVRLQA